jgi:tetratricopeptide (TPR) repeat protein
MADRRIAPLIAILFLVLAPVLAAADGDSAIGRDLRLHSAFLGSPELSDRYPGDHGLDVAARYVATELKKAGLAGGGSRGSYFREVALEVTPDPSEGYAVVRRKEGPLELAPLLGFRPLAATGGGTVSAPVVFAATPSDLTAAVRGRIALFVLHGEKSGEAVGAAVARGASAVLIAPDPRGRDRVTFADGRIEIGKIVDRGTEFLLTDRATGNQRRLTKDMVASIEFSVAAGPPGRAGGEVRPKKRAPIPVVGVSAAAVSAMLGDDLGEVLSKVDAGERPKSFLVSGVDVRLLVPSKGRRIAVRHVIAWLPGTDASLRRQVVQVRVVYGGVGDEGNAAPAGLALAAALARAGRAKRGIRIEFAVDTGAPAAASKSVIHVREPDLVTARSLFARIRQQADRPAPKPPAGGGRKPVAKGPVVRGTLFAARQARMTGKLDVAAREIAAALVKAPGDAALYLERGRIRIAGKKPDEARVDVRNLEKLDPEDARAHLLRFEIRDSEGKTREAIRSLELAMKARHPESLVRFVLRLPLDQPGAFLAARPKLVLAAKEGGASAWGRFAGGLTEALRGNDRGAETLFTQALDLDPLLAQAWYWRGRSRQAREIDSLGGARDFDRAEQLGVTAPTLWFERGLCRLRAKMYTQAIRDFEIFLTREPSAPAALYNIACAHALMRNTDRALDWLGKAVAAGFNDPAAARKDPDLASIRNHPRFEGILRSKRTD